MSREFTRKQVCVWTLCSKSFSFVSSPSAVALTYSNGVVVKNLRNRIMRMVKDKQSVVVALVKTTFAIATILSALWAVQVMSSAYLRVWGDKFREEQNRDRAEAFYKVSANIDPQNWRTHLGLGQIYSQTRYYELDPIAKREWAEKEHDEYLKAYRHNVKKEEVVYGLGRAELALGNREQGLDYLRQAAHYKRFNDFYWRKLGIELRKEGLYEEALETFLYAQKLDRSNKTVKRNIQWLREAVEREK